METEQLDNTRVLVAEDSALIAREVAEVLADAGCEVIGPFSRLDRLMDALEEEPADVAFLDVDLRGEDVFPAVERLIELSTPIVLTTGFNSGQIPERHRDLLHIEKPARAEQIVSALRKALADKAPLNRS